MIQLPTVQPDPKKKSGLRTGHNAGQNPCWDDSQHSFWGLTFGSETLLKPIGNPIESYWPIGKNLISYSKKKLPMMISSSGPRFFHTVSESQKGAGSRCKWATNHLWSAQYHLPNFHRNSGRPWDMSGSFALAVETCHGIICDGGSNGI